MNSTKSSYVDVLQREVIYYSRVPMPQVPFSWPGKVSGNRMLGKSGKFVIMVNRKSADRDIRE